MCGEKVGAEVPSSIKERFIESIEFLRKMGFLEEYVNLTSEEIFEKVKEHFKDIPHTMAWHDEEKWRKYSDFVIDSCVLSIDLRRYTVVDTELYNVLTFEQLRTWCKETLQKLASFSGGVFQPTRIACLKPINPGMWRIGEFELKISFTFKGKRHIVTFPFAGKYFGCNRLLAQLNALIDDTGYQYYQPYFAGRGEIYFLHQEEAEKLIKERGWELVRPVLEEKRKKEGNSGH